MGIFNTINALVSKSPQLDQHENNEQDAPTPAAGRTVLIIDDDRDFLVSTATALRAGGFTVLTSNNGPKGLNVLRYSPEEVCALLLDFHMPELDGGQTLTHARKLKPNMKIIGVTGLHPVDLTPEYREGVDTLLTKPFRNDAVLASVRSVLGLDPASVSASSS